jgi:hypothetical protein
MHNPDSIYNFTIASDPIQPLFRSTLCAGPGVITCAFTQLGDFEAVKGHNLVPGGDKVTHELFLVVILGIDFGEST